LGSSLLDWERPWGTALPCRAGLGVAESPRMRICDATRRYTSEPVAARHRRAQLCARQRRATCQHPFATDRPWSRPSSETARHFRQAHLGAENTEHGTENQERAEPGATRTTQLRTHPSVPSATSVVLRSAIQVPTSDTRYRTVLRWIETVLTKASGWGDRVVPPATRSGLVAAAKVSADAPNCARVPTLPALGVRVRVRGGPWSVGGSAERWIGSSGSSWRRR